MVDACRGQPPSKEMMHLLCNVAQILDVVKTEWSAESCWSEWDQSVRDGVTQQMLALRQQCKCPVGTCVKDTNSLVLCRKDPTHEPRTAPQIYFCMPCSRDVPIEHRESCPWGAIRPALPQPPASEPRAGLTDDEIADVGSTLPYFRSLPEYLDDDRWNNVEAELLSFARAIEKAVRERAAQPPVPEQAPVAYRKFLDPQYDYSDRYRYRDAISIGAPEGWEPLYAAPPASRPTKEV
jgi:hypothetical protein